VGHQLASEYDGTGYAQDHQWNGSCFLPDHDLSSRRQSRIGSGTRDTTVEEIDCPSLTHADVLLRFLLISSITLFLRS